MTVFLVAVLLTLAAVAAAVYFRGLNRSEKRSVALILNGRANAAEVLKKLGVAMQELYAFAAPRMRKDSDRQYLKDIREANQRFFTRARAALQAADNAIASRMMARANEQIRHAREIFSKIEVHAEQIRTHMVQIADANEKVMANITVASDRLVTAIQSAQALRTAGYPLDPERLFVRGAKLLMSAEQEFLSPSGRTETVSELITSAMVAIDTSRRDLEHLISRHTVVAGVLLHLPERISDLEQKINEARAAETKLRMRYGIRLEALEYRLSMLPNRLAEVDRLRRDVERQNAMLDVKRAESALDALEAVLRETVAVTAIPITRLRTCDEFEAQKGRQKSEEARSVTITPRIAPEWRVETQQSDKP